MLHTKDMTVLKNRTLVRQAPARLRIDRLAKRRRKISAAYVDELRNLGASDFTIRFVLSQVGSKGKSQ